MIQTAVVLLPQRPASLLHGATMSPLTHVGGLSVLARILLGLRWAGIVRCRVLGSDAWPEARELVRGDPRLRAFVELDDDAPAGDAPEGLAAAGQDLLVHMPGWITDRQVLRDVCRSPDPAGTVAFEATRRTRSGSRQTEPVLLRVPAAEARQVVDRLRAWSGSAPPRAHSPVGDAVQRRVLPEASVISVREREERHPAEEKLFGSLIKPTESFLSRNVERRISLAITRRLLRTRVTPNVVSVASLGIGLLGALLFLPAGRPAHVTGALLLLLSSIVDGCDGEMARLRFQESRFGSYLDFVGDNLVHAAAFFCIGMGLYLRGEGAIYLVLGGMGVLGTAGSAAQVFRRVFLRSGAEVITFSVPGQPQGAAGGPEAGRRQMSIADRLADRDFIYLIVVLAAAGLLRFWPWVSGIGSCVFCGYLFWMYRRTAPGTQEA